MSDAFQRFRYSFFEDPTSARDGLDTSSLAALDGDERRHAEIILLGFLPDARAVIGLGVLHSRAAAPKLTALFEAERTQQIEAGQDARMQPGGSDEWHPSALLYLAQALWRIQPDSRWPQAAIEVLSQAPHWVFRQEAVQALQDVNEPTAIQALISALDDAEPLVRHAAARGLLTLYGLPVDPVDPQAMAIRVMSTDAARHDAARQEILAVIAGRTAVER
jgi:HEAT repeat protein